MASPIVRPNEPPKIDEFLGCESDNPLAMKGCGDTKNIRVIDLYGKSQIVKCTGCQDCTKGSPPPIESYLGSDTDEKDFLDEESVDENDFLDEESDTELQDDQYDKNFISLPDEF